MPDITKKKFTEVMMDEFTGVVNEYDEPEDVEDFEKKLEEIWTRLTGTEIDVREIH